MTLPKILVDIPVPPELRKLLVGLCHFQTFADYDAAPGSAEEVRALFTYAHPEIDGAFMDRFPSLKIISNFGVGVDHLDLEAATARDLPVGNTPGAVDGATADFAFALLMAAARGVVTGDRFARSPEFTHFDPSLNVATEVHGSVLGIFGMGGVGRQIARRASGFDMRVLYHNRNRDLDTEEKLGVEYATREKILSEAQFVMLSLPLTPETTRFIGAEELWLMRPDAFLVNVARGPVVDTEALYRALMAGTIRGAAVDVTDPEPLPRDHPLLELRNIVIAPHLGSAADRSRMRMAEMSVENLRLGLAGEDLRWRVV